MSYQLVIRRKAERQIFRAQRWYDLKTPGTGQRFVETVNARLEVLVRTPLMYPVVDGTLRRAPLDPFPYGLFFAVRGSRVTVSGCLHDRRDPRRWRGG